MDCKKFFCCLLVLIPWLSQAQEQLGLRYDNYSGINSVVLNPANNITSKFTWDINLVEAGLFFDQNYGFIRNTNIIDIAKNADNILSATDVDNPNLNDPSTLLFDFYDNNRPKFISTNVETMGPSFMVHLASGHTFGIFTRARAMVGGKQLPPSLTYYNYERIIDEGELSVPEFKMAGMAWTEIGINYAREFETNAGGWAVGANLKFLNGYESFFIQNKTDFQVIRYGNDSIVSNNLDLEYGFTTSSIEQEAPNTKANGTGFGMDLGAIFTIEDGGDDYRIKFGVSLIDLGRISFDRFTESHALKRQGDTNLGFDEFDIVDNINSGTDLISEIILGDSSLSDRPGGYKIWLPTALSLQADFKVVDMIYINSTLVQQIPMPGPALARDNILALSPRFEHRWFGASFPISLYNWQDIRIGTSLRLAFLTLGTDNIGSIFGKSDFTGSDFYLALKVNPFKLKLGGGSRNGGKNVRCYEF